MIYAFFCRENDIRTSSGKFLRVESCHPESSDFLGLCLQGAQNLEYHGACRLAEFPRPHGGEIQKKYGGGAEKIYITNYCSQEDEKFSYFRQF